MEELSETVDNTQINDGQVNQQNQSMDQTQTVPVQDQTNGENTSNWEADKRYESMWNKDPNNMYVSYKNLESELENRANKISEFESKFSSLNEDLEKYSDINQFINLIDNDPVYSQRFADLISEYHKQKQIEKYGVELPNDVLEKLNKVEEFEKKFQQEEQNKKIEEQSKIISNQLTEVENLSKKYGIDYNKNELLEYCYKNNISPAYISYEFIKRALPNIEKMIETKTADSVIKNKFENGKTSIISSSSHSQNNTQSISLGDQLRKVFSVGG